MPDVAVYRLIDERCASITNNMVRMRTVIVAQKLFRLARKLGRWVLRIAQYTLAKLCGCGKTTVADAIKILVRLRVIESERRKAPAAPGGRLYIENQYRFHPEFLKALGCLDRSPPVEAQVNPGLFSFFNGEKTTTAPRTTATTWQAQVDLDQVAAEVAQLRKRFSPKQMPGE